MPVTSCRSFWLGSVALAATLATPAAFADYLWLERGAGQPAKAYLSNFQPSERLALSTLIQVEALLGEGKRVPLAASGDGFPSAQSVAGDLRVSAKQTEPGKLTLYEAKEGRSETKARNDLELVPTTANGNTFKLYWKGGVVSASQVNVYTSRQWNRTIKPAADGSVTLDTPFPGQYVLEVVAQVNGAVTVQGQKFDTVVHVATLSFNVPG